MHSRVPAVFLSVSLTLVAGCGDAPGGVTAAGGTESGSSSGDTDTSSGSQTTPGTTDPTTGIPTGGTGSGGDSMSTSGGTPGTTDTPGTTTTATTGEPPAPGCGDGKLDLGEACDDGNDNEFDGCLANCTTVEPLDTEPLEWEYIEVPGTLCMNGDTAGFGISRNPDSKNVMIYLEGGGACFNDACDFSAFNIPFIPPPDGIFNRNNPQNPVKDWSMIYVPYCTGDIHGGNRDTLLGGQVRYFRGFTNITTYLKQWVPTFADADTVLLTGISAGGFGAALNTIQVADAFGPGPQLVTIDDSGPPMSNAVIPPCLQQQFRDVWGLDDTILAECGNNCPDPNDFATGLIDHTFTKHPEVRFGLFSNTADAVISLFMSFGWGNGMHDNCEGVPLSVPANVYTDGLMELRDNYSDIASTYYVFGVGHTVLRSPSFWTTFVDGTPLPQWIAGVIDGEVQHVGP